MQQQLGALAGCRDELSRFGQILNESTKAATLTKEVTQSFLLEHEHSVINNAANDLERVEVLQRSWCAFVANVLLCTCVTAVVAQTLGFD